MSSRPFSPPRLPRHGTTLLEMVLVLGICGLLVAIIVPKIRSIIDRSAARGAVSEAAATFGVARRLAIARRSAVAVRIDTSYGVLAVVSQSRRLDGRHLGSRYGVSLKASRDSMAFDARGLGVGLANLSLIIRRRSVAETLFISRLGRIR